MKWVKIEDSLPVEEGLYLVHAPTADVQKPLITVAWYNPKSGWSLLHPYWLKAITHWMPLPKAPQKED